MVMISPRLVVRTHLTLVLSFALLTPGAAALQVSLVGQAMKIDPPDTSEPFDILDTFQGSNVDLLLWSIDGMTFDPSGEELYVVNPYGGRVLRFNVTGEPNTPPAGNSFGVSGALGVLGSRGGFSAGGGGHSAGPVKTGNGHLPDLSIQVPWGVTSLEYWVSDVDQHEELLAIGRGNYGLTRIHPDTGALLDFVPLPSEPADILIEPLSNHVFVSCSGADVVLELDLDAGTIVETYDILTSRNIAHLSTDGLGNVYAAPMTSGNASMAFRGNLGHDQVGGDFVEVSPGKFQFLSVPILDMRDPDNSATSLPDHDLFRLMPGGSPKIEVAATGLGTNLFGHGFHPTTGEFWVLNTEAINQDIDKQTEALLTGIFIQDRLTLADLSGGGGALPRNLGDHKFISLDDLVIPPATTGSGRAVGKPYALHFADDGSVFVLGMLSDNLVRLDANGGVLQVWDLPGDGSIPRDVLMDSSGTRVFVYCWGTNLVQILDLVHDSWSGKPLELGYDPTSASRKRGRALFYDGDNSQNGNASCESCHVEGGFDFLVWNLSDIVKDDKGPMFTQNLRGIEALNPYHWRGERAELTDFNGAFHGLLGGSELSPADFADFQDFVFGMVESANPRTHLHRVVVDGDPDVLEGFNLKGDPVSPSLSAIAGQQLYFDEPTVGVNTCQDCHTLPTGTANDFFHDGLQDKDHRGSMDVPAYNGLWRKEQKARLQVDVFGTLEDRPPLGSSTTHAGLRTGVYEFVTEVFGNSIDLSQSQDIAAFMHQIDSGIAPAVHQAVLLDQAHQPDAGAFASFLQGRAVLGDCDLAAFGSVTIPRFGALSLRWYLDTSVVPPVWVAENRNVPDQDLAFFIAQADAGTGSLMVSALPVGMGRRWGVDADDDLLFNADERGFNADPYDPDPDGDGFLDGVEVAYFSAPDDPADTPVDVDDPELSVDLVYVTGRVAKLNVVTNEPTTIRVDYSISGVPATPATSDTLATHHTLLLRDLDPSYATDGVVTTITATVTATDQGANTDTEVLTPFVTQEFIIAIEQTSDPIIEETLVKSFGFVSQALEPGGGFRLKYEALLHHQKRFTNPELVDHALVCRIFLAPAPADPDDELVFSRTDDFSIENFPGGPIDGPILLFDQLPGLPSGPGLPFIYPGVGNFLISPPSVAGANAGEVQLEFVLPLAQTGDRLLLVVETVAAVDPLTWPGDALIDGAFHFNATRPDARFTETVVLGPAVADPE